jgi:hypothetical protein
MKTISWLISIGLFASSSELINFDRAPLGKMPGGWVNATTQGKPALWQIVRDPTAPSPPYVLARVAGEPDPAVCPLAILDKPYLKDGEVSVRFKPVSGKEQRDGGVVWRYHDANNYYVVRADALEKNIAMFKVQNGVRIPLTGKTFRGQQREIAHEVPTNDWSTLKVVFKGSQFSVFYNHRRLLQVDDRTFTSPGKIGLWTKADSITYFDDFKYVAK